MTIAIAPKSITANSNDVMISPDPHALPRHAASTLACCVSYSCHTIRYFSHAENPIAALMLEHPLRRLSMVKKKKKTYTPTQSRE